MSRRVYFALCRLSAAGGAGAGFPAATYEAELDPAPFDATNRADVINSIGNVTATLDGSMLTVKGTFSNFTSPATGGSFRIGLAKGVPGDAIGTLTCRTCPPGRFLGRDQARCGATGRPQAAGALYPHR